MERKKYTRAEVMEFVTQMSIDPELNAEMDAYQRPETVAQKARRFLALRCGFWFFAVLHSNGMSIDAAKPLCALFARNSVVNEPVALAIHYAEQFEAYGEIRVPSLIAQTN